MRAAHRERPRSDRVPHPPRLMIGSLRPAARFVARRRLRVRVHQAELVPRRGPVVFAANHVGISDGPLLACFAPRPVHALTKVEMFTGPLGWLLRHSGQIPVNRFHADARAVRQCLRVLRDGGALGIFPEGARGSGELELFHRGAAYFAMVTGAPIVPVILIGTREPGGHSDSVPPRGSDIDLVFGAPFEVEPVEWPRTRGAVGELSRELRDRMLLDLHRALDLTGRTLPGPLPAGQHEPDPGGGVTQASA